MEEEVFSTQPPASFSVSISEVLSKVNWIDVPILVLISFHLSVFMISFAFRKNKVLRSVCFAFCLAFVYMSEKIGDFMHSKWEFFGFSQNYFDDNGIFIAVFFVLPPLFTCIVLFSVVVGNLGGHVVNRIMIKNEKPEEKPHNE